MFSWFKRSSSNQCSTAIDTKKEIEINYCTIGRCPLRTNFSHDHTELRITQEKVRSISVVGMETVLGLRLPHDEWGVYSDREWVYLKDANLRFHGLMGGEIRPVLHVDINKALKCFYDIDTPSKILNYTDIGFDVALNQLFKNPIEGQVGDVT